MNVVAYVRTATIDASTRDQVEAIDRFCFARGLKVVELFGDYGGSGLTLDRPGLDQATAYLAAHQDCRGLVVSSLDRLSRSTANLVTLYETHFSVASRKDVFSAREPIDPRSPSYAFFRNMMPYVAKFETWMKHQEEDENQRRRLHPSINPRTG